MSWLSGCGAANFDPSFGIIPAFRVHQETESIVEAVTVCPPLVQYDQDFLDQMAKGVEQLDDSSVIWVMIEDYGRLREAIRQC